MVKELRDATQAGMMECKKALVECDGDMKKASEYLQIKGLAKAAKRGARKTSEGFIGVYTTEDNKGLVLAEVNCETDFVARTDAFKQFCNDLALHIYKTNPTAENILNTVWMGEGADTLEVKRGNLSASTGENIRIGRFVRIVSENGRVAFYRHHDGKGAVAVEVATGNAANLTNEMFADFLFELCLHVFACKPVALDPASLDPAAVADQRNICLAKVAESGKPEAMHVKIAEGMLNKWYSEVALLNQLWQGEGKENVEAKRAALAKALKDTVTIKGFSRIVIGEGVVAEEEAPEEA